MVTLDQGGRGAVGLRLVAPPADLRSTVEHLWIQQPLPGASPSQPWRIVADDAPCLVGSVTACGSRLALVGARTTYLDIDVSNRRLTVGARLRPGALPALFGVPSEAFTDRAFRLGDVLGREPNAVLDPLAAFEVPGTVQALVTLLRRRVATGREVDRRVAALVAAEAAGAARIGTSSRALGLSDRTLRDVSRRHLGMGMKRLWRIRRLHRAVHLGITRPGVGWAGLAAATGYADQAHLIRECRAFLGETPTAFIARAL